MKELTLKAKVQDIFSEWRDFEARFKIKKEISKAELEQKNWINAQDSIIWDYWLNNKKKTRGNKGLMLPKGQLPTIEDVLNTDYILKVEGINN